MIIVPPSAAAVSSMCSLYSNLVFKATVSQEKKPKGRGLDKDFHRKKYVLKQQFHKKKSRKGEVLIRISKEGCLKATVSQEEQPKGRGLDKDFHRKTYVLKQQFHKEKAERERG
jgi:hypothetical protein